MKKGDPQKTPGEEEEEAGADWRHREGKGARGQQALAKNGAGLKQRGRFEPAACPVQRVLPPPPPPPPAKHSGLLAGGYARPKAWRGSGTPSACLPASARPRAGSECLIVPAPAPFIGHEAPVGWGGKEGAGQGLPAPPMWRWGWGCRLPSGSRNGWAGGEAVRLGANSPLRSWKRMAGRWWRQRSCDLYALFRGGRREEPDRCRALIFFSYLLSRFLLPHHPHPQSAWRNRAHGVAILLPEGKKKGGVRGQGCFSGGGEKGSRSLEEVVRHLNAPSTCFSQTYGGSSRRHLDWARIRERFVPLAWRFRPCQRGRYILNVSRERVS